MKTKITILLLVIVTAIGACKKENECTTGNGDIVQTTRDVGEYNTVTANGALNLTYGQTGVSQVDLYGDSNILPLIKTRLTNTNLTVGTEGSDCYTTNNTIEVTLSSPLITSITLNGSGMIVGNGINQDELYYQSNGSAVINSSFNLKDFESRSNGTGDASYAGTAESCIFTIAGAGNIYAATLQTDKCTITISGSGDVRIHVNQELNVTITGEGSVYYSGDPGILNTNITGTGQVIKQ